MIPGIRLVSINFASLALLIGKTESEISVRDTPGDTQCLLCVLCLIHKHSKHLVLCKMASHNALLKERVSVELTVSRKRQYGSKHKKT